MQSVHSKVNQGKYNIPRQSIDSKFQQDEYLVVLVNKSEVWILETATGHSHVKPPLVAPMQSTNDGLARKPAHVRRYN